MKVICAHRIDCAHRYDATAFHTVSLLNFQPKYAMCLLILRCIFCPVVPDLRDSLCNETNVNSVVCSILNMLQTESGIIAIYCIRHCPITLQINLELNVETALSKNQYVIWPT